MPAARLKGGRDIPEDGWAVLPEAARIAGLRRARTAELPSASEFDEAPRNDKPLEISHAPAPQLWHATCP